MSETAGRQVLLVSSPLKSLDELRDTRAYVKECLEEGIMVLSPGMGYEFVSFPPISGVCVIGGQPHPQTPRKAPATSRSIKIRGRDKLLAYRKAAGLGCYNTLAAALGGRLTADVLRLAASGDETLTTDEWRRIGEAVDRLQSKGAVDGQDH